MGPSDSPRRDSETSPAFDRRFREATRIAHRRFQDFLGSRYGVRFVESWYVSDRPVRLPGWMMELRDVFPDVTEHPPRSHPFPRRYATSVTTLFVEPGRYLRSLLEDVRRAGAESPLRRGPVDGGCPVRGHRLASRPFDESLGLTEGEAMPNPIRTLAAGAFPVAALLTLSVCGPPVPDRSPDEAAAGESGAVPFPGGRWVDLTHPFSSETVYWPTARGFQLDTLAYGPTEEGYFYAAFDFAAAEHGGTHLDAPLHFAEGRPAADEIPLDRLIAPAVVVDVSDSATPDYRITVEDLEEFEASHGAIPAGAILLLRTGWDERYGDRTRYLGTDRTGPDAVAELHFPGLHPEAARWLVENREVAAVGIDTPSIDYGQSTTYESHVVLYSAEVPGFENVADLVALPPVGSYVVALPMKIQGGSGAPLRIVAWVPDLEGGGGP